MYLLNVASTIPGGQNDPLFKYFDDYIKVIIIILIQREKKESQK